MNLVLAVIFIWTVFLFKMNVKITRPKNTVSLIGGVGLDENSILSFHFIQGQRHFVNVAWYKYNRRINQICLPFEWTTGFLQL
jgi:hypothetical protein